MPKRSDNLKRLQDTVCQAIQEAYDQGFREGQEDLKRKMIERFSSNTKR